MSWFEPSRPGGSPAGAVSGPFWIMVVLLLAVAGAAYATILLDHPFLISSHSRALYVDEGFYSAGAQNFAKFGHWGFPFDFPHWVGAPFLTMLQSLVFPVFGASLDTARMLSVVLSLVTALAFYSLARMSLSPGTAALLTISSVLTFNYAANARSALADPVAVCAAMLALLAFARLRVKTLAIPLSLALALAATFTKPYYIFTPAVIAALWAVELIIVPAWRGQHIDRRLPGVLVVSAGGLGALLLGFLYVFQASFAERFAVGAGKLPLLDLAYLRDSLLYSMQQLPYNTKAHVYLAVIPIGALVALVLLLLPGTRQGLHARFNELSRADAAVAVWLVAGLLLTGTLRILKPHYQFFAILPLCFAGVTALRLIAPGRLRTILIGAIPVIHLAFQWPYYERWMQRPEKTAFLDASREIVRTIHQDSSGSMVPVIGEYASQLGLFSPRIFPLDAKWAPEYSLCERVHYWQPRFHVNIVWPGSRSQQETQWIADCSEVDTVKEVARYPVFEPRNDELVLSRIAYTN